MHKSSSPIIAACIFGVPYLLRILIECEHPACQPYESGGGGVPAGVGAGLGVPVQLGPTWTSLNMGGVAGFMSSPREYFPWIYVDGTIFNAQQSCTLVSLVADLRGVSTNPPPRHHGPKCSQFRAVFWRILAKSCVGAPPASGGWSVAPSYGEPWMLTLITVFKVRHVFTRINHGSFRIAQWEAALYRHKTRRQLQQEENHVTEAKKHVTLPVTLSVGGLMHAQIHTYSVKLVKLAKIFSYWQDTFGEWNPGHRNTILYLVEPLRFLWCPCLQRATYQFHEWLVLSNSS